MLTLKGELEVVGVKVSHLQTVEQNVTK